MKLLRYKLRRSYAEQYPQTGDKMVLGAEVVRYQGNDNGLADIDAMQLGKQCISISLNLETGEAPFYVVVQSDLQDA